MKIGDYTVAMDAQYYNLALSQTEAQIQETTQGFTKNKSTEVEKTEVNLAEKNRASFELSRELTKGILQNIGGESKKLRGDTVEISTSYAEAQGLNFQTAAKVQVDGKELNVGLNISLSRSFVQKTSLTVDLIQKKMKDPLVISLNGQMPNLSTKTFSFDIDSDGQNDQISQLKRGNGFLALDKNNNGTIDNGTELFGTKSGDGFADLKAYDNDKNGWIDENDAIFSKLRIWQKGEGKDTLLALGEVGIGAIFLGSTETPFSIKSETNATLGEIRKSGMVLFEDGHAGVISQVDLAVNVKNNTVEEQTKEDLQSFEQMQKNTNIFNINSLYKEGEGSSGSMGNKKLEKLQSQIKELRKQLTQAEETQKASLNVQIGALFSQMMSMLEQEFK